MNRYNTTEKIDKKHSKIEQIGEYSAINITFQIIRNRNKIGKHVCSLTFLIKLFSPIFVF